MDFPASVANKRLTVGLSPLDATLPKNRGEGSPTPPARLPLSWHLIRLAFRPIPIPYALSPFLSYSCSTLLHTATRTTLFHSISYVLSPSHPRPHPTPPLPA